MVSLGNARTSFLVDPPPRRAKFTPRDPAKRDSAVFPLAPPRRNETGAAENAAEKTPDFNKNLGNQGYPVVVANFADLCLTAHHPPSRLPARLAAQGVDETLSPSVGIINSVLIGSLFWIGVVAAIVLI